jgi:hypothetical protein
MTAPTVVAGSSKLSIQQFNKASADCGHDRFTIHCRARSQPEATLYLYLCVLSFAATGQPVVPIDH